MSTVKDDNTPYKLMVEQGSTPVTPAAGKQKIFIDSADHHLKLVDSSGTVTDLQEAVAAGDYPMGYFYGFTLSNNGGDANNDIDIAVGACRDDGNANNITLASALTKQLDAAWAAGTNAGGLDTGSKANSTWYHLYAILKPADGTVDVLFTATYGSPTMPSGYTKKRYLGSVLTNASGNIRAFLQTGSAVEWSDSTLTLDVDVTNLSTSRVLYTLTVPPGLKVRARFNAGMLQTGANGRVLATDPDTADIAPGSTGYPQRSFQNPVANQILVLGPYSCITNTSGQIGLRADAASTTVRVATLGWDYLR